MTETKKEANGGYIYIMQNPYVPDLIKIGYTQNIQARLNQLNSETGTPRGWKLYAKIKAPFYAADKKIHSIITTLAPELRIDERREFFRMDPEIACDILSYIGTFFHEDVISAEDLNRDTASEEEQQVADESIGSRSKIRETELNFLQNFKEYAFSDIAFASTFSERKPNIRSNYCDYFRRNDSAVGAPHIVLRARSREIAVEWYMADPDNQLFDYFFSRKDEIISRLKQNLNWNEEDIEWSNGNGYNNSKIIKTVSSDGYQNIGKKFDEIKKYICVLNDVFYAILQERNEER